MFVVRIKNACKKMGLVVVFVIDCYSTVKWQLCGLDRVQYCPKVSAGLLWARNKKGGLGDLEVKSE